MIEITGFRLHFSYDLHTHSYCSDGQLSPTELVELAKRNNVKVMALTDHDTLSGINEAKSAAGADLEIITGIELSSVWQGRNIHIVGLNIDLDSESLQSAVAYQSQVRNERALKIAERLEKKGVKGALDGAKHYAKGASIGRPHFAEYMVDAGYVNSFSQAFNHYLGAGKPGDVKHCWPEIATVIEWIETAGGVAVLAHPARYNLTRTKLYALVEDFVNAGGKAIEVVSGQQDVSVTSQLIRITEKFSLSASCGSDFHSLANGWQSPGKMSPFPQSCIPVWETW
jgi:predicted metal-dependent phosphoesterase TrpH